MPRYEESFIQRLTKGRELLHSLNGFTPPFVPADDSLSLAHFGAFLDSLEERNDGIALLEVERVATGADRRALLEKVRRRGTRTLNYLRSNSAWEAAAYTAAAAVGAMRPPGPRRKTAPPEPGEAEVSPEGAESAPMKAQKSAGTGRPRARLSAAEMAGHLEKLRLAAEGAAGYAPPVPEITVAGLAALLAELRALNDTVGSQEAELSALRAERRELNAGKDGLRGKVQRLKAAVKGLYGTGGPEWAVLRRLRW